MLRQLKFTKPAALIILIFLGLTVAIVYGIITKSSTETISSYKQCLNSKNSTILLTFPQVCVTADGLRFTTPESAP